MRSIIRTLLKLKATVPGAVNVTAIGTIAGQNQLRTVKEQFIVKHSNSTALFTLFLLTSVLFSTNANSAAVLVCNFSELPREYRWDGFGAGIELFSVPAGNGFGWAGVHQKSVGIFQTQYVDEVTGIPDDHKYMQWWQIEYYQDIGIQGPWPTNIGEFSDGATEGTWDNTIIAVGIDGWTACRNIFSPGPSERWCNEEADPGNGGQMTDFQWYDRCGSDGVPVSPPLRSWPDSDGDSIRDQLDNCPWDYNPGQEDTDGDGIGNACDYNQDSDSWADSNDNCPLISNEDQADNDGDGQGDACDDDDDNDLVWDVSDNCQWIPNPGQEDNENDGAGDVCDPDDDNDSYFDDVDNCPLTQVWNQDDIDNDGIGDACDDDIDGDAVLNDFDNCPIAANPSQVDNDSDGEGDACDADDDNDGIFDVAPDNCPLVANPYQVDIDYDGIGDACDGDRDGDGHANAGDNCPDTANSSQNDFDGDLTGDACDDDADADGVPDIQDSCLFTELGDVIESSSGCSIEQLVPCEGPMGTTTGWRNRGMYVSAVTQSLNNFVEMGLISNKERNIRMRSAMQSSCGKKSAL